MRQHEHVAQGAPAVLDLVAEQRLALEPEVREHSHGGLLLGDHLHDELAQPRLRGLHDRVAGECAADAAAAGGLGHDEADGAPVRGPARQRREEDDAEDLAVALVDRRPAPRAPLATHPRGGAGRVVEILLDERPVAFGQFLQEPPEGVEMARLERFDGHATASSVRAARNSMMVGMVTFAAVRPTTRPMWPASSRSSSFSSEPTSSTAGAAVSGGTMWSRHAMTLR